MKKHVPKVTKLTYPHPPSKKAEVTPSEGGQVLSRNHQDVQLHDCTDQALQENHQNGGKRLKDARGHTFVQA
jgi:hypothetical protein